MKRSAKTLFFTFWIGVSIGGCAQNAPRTFPSGEPSFESYALQTKAYVAQNRTFVTDDKIAELEGNSPFEIRPKHPNGQAVLMIHGLGDSPWTYRDVGRMLADHGYLVRALLLPGHGTKPQDMVGVKSSEWVRAVNEQMALLKQQYSDVWIAGFSTGCNLALDYADRYRDVSGLILFSPAMEIRTSLIKIAPFVNHFITWLRAPDKRRYNAGPFKYDNIPLDAIVAFKDTMDESYQNLIRNKITVPAIVMMSQHDSVVNTQKLLPIFERQLVNPASRIIWYGSLPENVKASEKILVRPDYLPNEKIKSFAHMSLPFSPDNDWYGVRGKFRYCNNSLSAAENERCRAESDIWYGAWGTKGKEEPYARLTFNPYFRWQSEQILKVLASKASQSHQPGNL